MSLMLATEGRKSYDVKTENSNAIIVLSKQGRPRNVFNQQDVPEFLNSEAKPSVRLYVLLYVANP